MSNQEHSYLQTGMSLLNTGIQAFLQNKQLNNNRALGIVSLRLEKDKIDGLQKLSDLQARLSIIKTKADISKNNYLAEDSINAFEDSFNTAYTAYLKNTNQERNERTYNKFREYYGYNKQRKAYDTNTKKYTDINTEYSTEINNLFNSYFDIDSANEVKSDPVPEPSVGPYKVNNNINGNRYNNQIRESIIRPSPFFDYVKNKNLWSNNDKSRL